MKNIKTAAEEEFQKLPLKEKEKLVSVVQTWNKAFECGVNYAKKSACKEAEQLLDGSKINPDNRYEITEKGKEYLNSH